MRGKGSDIIGQCEGLLQPKPETRRQDILACLLGIGDVPGEMGKAGLVCIRMSLLRGVAIGAPDIGPMPVHQRPDHDCATCRSGLMDNRLGATKHPLVGVASFDPHAGLVGGDDLGPTQRRDGDVALGREGTLRTAQYVHQAALADGETEQVREDALQPLVGQGLEGFEIGRHRMQPRPERRPPCLLGHGRSDKGAARRATNRQAPMALDQRLDAARPFFEAADDICYLTTDIEDSFRVKMLQFQEAEQMLKRIVDVGQHLDGYSRFNNAEDQDRIAYLRSMAVRSLAEGAATAWTTQRRALLERKGGADLLETSQYAQNASQIRDLCKTKIYKEPKKLQLEAAGYEMIISLMELFGGMIDEMLREGINDLNMRNQGLYQLLPREFRDQLKPQDAYGSYLVLVDYVAGMTDRFALDLFQRLTGSSVSLGRMA